MTKRNYYQVAIAAYMAKQMGEKAEADLARYSATLFEFYTLLEQNGMKAYQLRNGQYLLEWKEGRRKITKAFDKEGDLIFEIAEMILNNKIVLKGGEEE